MIRLYKAGVIAALNLLVLTGLAVGASPASAAVPTCQPGAPQPTNQYPGKTVIATNFESGSLTTAGFAAAFTAGTGTAAVSSAQQHSGRCSAYVHVTTDAGSVANFSAPLPAGNNEVYADGWFNITKEGVAGNNVPYFRFFNGTTRFIDVYRSNGGVGPMWLRVAAPDGTLRYTPMKVNVPLGTWHHIVTHVVANGASSTVEVIFDGKLLYSSKQIATGFTAVTKMQLGAEHRRQAGDSFIDDVVIKAGKAAAQLPGTFAPIAPQRFLDTRKTVPVGADKAVSFQVAGANGIPANVAAVVFNLTVTEAKSIGYITAYPSGTTKPDASNVNFRANQNVPNLVTVKVGADGKVALFNRSSGTTHLIADVTGYYVTGTPATPGAFQSLAPKRLLDTRSTAALAGDATVSLLVRGTNGIPTTASAVVFNLTVTEPTRIGYITAYASGSKRPDASNLNFNAGQTVPNLVTVPIGADGRVTLLNRSFGRSHLIADVAGYYLGGTPTATGAFKATGPSRILDTRPSAAVRPDSTVSFQIAGTTGIPANVLGAVFNLTVVAPPSIGYITAYPSGSTRPDASNLNFSARQTVANLVSVPVGSDGKVTLFNRSSGSSHLIADLAGYFLP